MNSKQSKRKRDEGRGDGGGARDANGRSEAALQFLVDLKFRNRLPPIPFDPKFLRVKTKRDRFYKYRTSSLEANYQYKVHIQPSLGPAIHLIDPDSAAVPNTPLEEADRRLLRGDADSDRDDMILNGVDNHLHDIKDSTSSAVVDLSESAEGPAIRFVKRAQKARSGKSWLLKTQYLDNNLSRSIHNYASGADEAKKRVDDYLIKRNEWEQKLKQKPKLERILDSFDYANNGDLPSHSRKPELKPVKVFHVLPEFELCKNEYYQVSFTDLRVLPEITETNKEKCRKTEDLLYSNVKLAQVTDSKDDSNVALLLPKKREVDALDEDLEDSIPYHLDKLQSLRDYKFTIRSFKPHERFAFLWDSQPARSLGQTKYGTVNFIPIEENAIELNRNPTLYPNARARKVARLQEFNVERREFTKEEKEERQQRLQTLERSSSSDHIDIKDLAQQNENGKDVQRNSETKTRTLHNTQNGNEDEEVSSDSSSSNSSDSSSSGDEDSEE